MALHMKCISSTRNRRIQHALKLRQGTHRRQQGHTLIEGEQEIARALYARLPFHAIYLCSELAENNLDPELTADLHRYARETAVPLFHISRHVHDRLAMRGSTGGIVVEASCPPAALRSLPQAPHARYVVLEDADRPGNIGAVLRTAAATAITGLILAQHQGTGTDLGNPNVIRASLGTVFDVPAAQASSTAVLAWLRAQQCALIVCAPTGRSLYAPVAIPGPAAFVFGSEAQGLSPLWHEAAHAQLAIPMADTVDSLNLSVSVAVVLYEFLRRAQAADPATVPAQ